MIFEARNSRGRLALLLLGAVAFVVAGFWVVGLFGAPPKPGREWVGWASILFFGYCAAIAARRMFDEAVQIRMSAEGIIARRWSDETIPWTEITDVSVWTYRRQNRSSCTFATRPDFPEPVWQGGFKVRTAR